MSTPTHTHTPATRGAAGPAGEPPTPSGRARGGRDARAGGLLALAAVAASCGVTTLLLATGLAAAGGGHLGSLELAVAAVAVPMTVLAWRVRSRRRSRP